MIVKEERKIIRSGPSLVVTMPAWWLRHMGLGKGSIMLLSFDNEKLVLRPKPEEKHEIL